ncbi:magnesium transporter NIPA-domain-containing protein [Phlebopus sp. FC_14]|nr:magnesium transporter NIPA-domain-containing protein [Phlebopus sp. FC_14]
MSSTATSGTASATSSGSSTSSFQLPSSLKVIGIILAVTSGVLIGSSFVFKKKGLLRSQAGRTAGEGVAYLKSPLWWTGMIMMILGELCNFAAYAFVEALVVTPMGALSVVICAILSSIFLKEKLTFFGWLGCALCIIGSVIIALNGPQEQTPSEISQFKSLFLAPGFLAYISVLVAIALSIVIYFGPRYGKQNMLWYITVCSTIGGISVSVTTGLGSAIVTTAMGHNQFNNWFIFFLMAFVVVTLLTEVYYLNVALALFNTAMVTPTYYVLFSFCSMVTTIVLFKGLSAPVSQILTLVLAFLTICVGITILQMSKIDPMQLKSLDRRSTMLLQAARSHTDKPATYSYTADESDGEGGEKSLSGLEDPGIDALRGSFGTVGSIIRARSARRMSQSSRSGSSVRSGGAAVRGMGVGGGMVGNLEGVPFSALHRTDHAYDGLTRHQLYDAPMPSTHAPSTDRASSFSSTQSPRQTMIKFGSQDLVHSYGPPGSKDTGITHELRSTTFPPNHEPKTPPSFLYPPTASTSSIPLMAEGLSSIDKGSTPSTPGAQTQSQAVVVPQRANDEPPAPTISSKYFSPVASDPFETPTTPSMSAFPPSNDYNTNNSTPYNGGVIQSAPFVGSGSSLGNGSGSSAQALYGPMGRSSREEDTRSRRERRSNSTSQSRKYPKGADDAEESISLWEQGSPIDEEEPNSVRLVQPGSRIGGRF